jgi:hypothetical protein
MCNTVAALQRLSRYQRHVIEWGVAGMSAKRRSTVVASEAAPRRRTTLFALAGLAVSCASTLAMILGSNVPRQTVELAANWVTYIDGTNYPNGSTRMGNALGGYYSQQPQFIDYYINNTSVYPGTLGPYNGLNFPNFSNPSGNTSVNDGSNAILSTLATQYNTDPTGHFYVVCYSLGCAAASKADQSITNAPSNNSLPPPSQVTMVMLADPNRPNGGILARLPPGTYIPILGITGGTATPSNGANVIMYTKQYDGVADAPAYVLILPADLNALLGAYYLHGGNYTNVQPCTPTCPAGYIVTTSPNGQVTDVLVPAPPGQLPIEMPLAQAGVPAPILVALDPVLRAVIETGYARGSDPSQQVTFSLLPPPNMWVPDVISVGAGAGQTLQELPGAVVASAQTPLTGPSVPSLPLSTSPLNTPSSPLASTLSPLGSTSGPVKVLQNAAPPVNNPPSPTPSPLISVTNLVPNTVNMANGNKVVPGGILPTVPATTGTPGTLPGAGNPVSNVVAGATNALGGVASSVGKTVSGVAGGLGMGKSKSGG